MNINFEAFKPFLEEHIIADISVASPSSDIEDDLLICGDDAIDFIMAYSKEYNVDVSKFMAADYISAEGGQLFGRLFGKPLDNEPARRKKLTIQNLLDGIHAGKLDESTIEKSNACTK